MTKRRMSTVNETRGGTVLLNVRVLLYHFTFDFQLEVSKYIKAILKCFLIYSKQKAVSLDFKISQGVAIDNALFSTGAEIRLTRLSVDFGVSCPYAILPIVYNIFCILFITFIIFV